MFRCCLCPNSASSRCLSLLIRQCSMTQHTFYSLGCPCVVVNESHVELCSTGYFKISECICTVQTPPPPLSSSSTPHGRCRELRLLLTLRSRSRMQSCCTVGPSMTRHGMTADSNLYCTLIQTNNPSVCPVSKSSPIQSNPIYCRSSVQQSNQYNYSCQMQIQMKPGSIKKASQSMLMLMLCSCPCPRPRPRLTHPLPLPLPLPLPPPPLPPPG